jgi:hypothetical protein
MPPKKKQVAKSCSSSKDNGSAEPTESVENRTSRSQMSRDKRIIDVTIEEKMEEVLMYKGYYCRKHKAPSDAKPKSPTDIDLSIKYRSLDEQSLDNQRSIARRNQVSDDTNEDIIKSTITLAGDYTFEKLFGIKLAKQVDELRRSVKYNDFSESNKEVTIAGTDKEKIFVAGERLKRWATATGILAPRLACTFVTALNPNQLLQFTKSRTGNQYFLSLKEEQAEEVITSVEPSTKNTHINTLSPSSYRRYLMTPVLFEMEVPFAVPKLLMVGHAELPQGQVPKVDITFGRLVFEDGVKRLEDLTGSHVNSLNELKVGTGGDITRKFYNSLPNQITGKVLHTLGELYGTPNLIKEFMIEVTDALVPDTVFVYKIKEDRTGRYKYNLLHNRHKASYIKNIAERSTQMFIARARSNQLATNNKMKYWNGGNYDNTCRRCFTCSEDQWHLFTECQENSRYHHTLANSIKNMISDNDKIFPFVIKPIRIPGTLLLLSNTNITQIPPNVDEHTANEMYMENMGLFTTELFDTLLAHIIHKPHQNAKKILTLCTNTSQLIWLDRCITNAIHKENEIKTYGA